MLTSLNTEDRKRVKRAAMPAFTAPMLATLTKQVFSVYVVNQRKWWTLRVSNPRPSPCTSFRSVAGFCQLILHDRRGVGLSSRNVPPPNLETRVADLQVILDEVGSKRPVLAGSYTIALYTGSTESV